MMNSSNYILIYSPLITNRLKYIFNLILNQVLGLSTEFTDNKDVFKNSSSPKFSYGIENHFSDELFISAYPLLYEKDIHFQQIETFIYKEIICFFKSSENSFFPFDIFAASFYLVSRYEEYLPYKADSFDRFPANESLAFKKGFLEIPLVNIWINMFSEKLCDVFPDLVPKKDNFKFLSTIDIDNAWAHLHKGIIRTCLSFVKICLTGDIKKFITKFKVVFLKNKDPFDTYEFIFKIHEKYKLDPLFFVLFSKYSDMDKNPSQKNVEFRKLIKAISKRYIIGMHPSFYSNNSVKLLEEEKKKLEKLIEKPVNYSRQHYLILKLPRTYENIMNAGIECDYSMGYSTHIGFRASFCLPFNFFNLVENKETYLQVIPFALMDVCFKEYQKIDTEIALIRIKKIINSVKKINGLFVSLWHNENLIDSKDKLNWRIVFELMLKEATNGDKIP